MFKAVRLLLPIVCLLLVTVQSLRGGQFIENWRVAQPYLEGGYSKFDYNRDGTFELTKMYLNSFTAYNGADSFKVIWSLTADNYDDLVIYKIVELRPGAGDRALFTEAQSGDTSATRVLSYRLLNNAADWQSDLLPGYCSNLDAADLDTTAGNEVCIGLNQYISATQRYRSIFYVLDGSDGSTIWDSGWFSGYMIGPYLNNIDADPAGEILVNLYFASDTTSSLRVFSYDGGAGVFRSKPIPEGVTLAPAYPNPFNSTSMIPVTLKTGRNVRVFITDALGRTVAVLLEGRMNPGAHLLSWDGTTSQGTKAAPGSYFCQVVTDESRACRPLVLIK